MRVLSGEGEEENRNERIHRKKKQDIRLLSLRHCKERQSGTRGLVWEKVRKRCGKKQSCDKKKGEAEDFERLSVLKGDSGQSRGDRLTLCGLFVAKTE